MDCKQKENLTDCTCTYEPCSSKGICCKCVASHQKSRQLPGCFFPMDRSFENFARLVREGKI
jgi:hypothetical protein